MYKVSLAYAVNSEAAILTNEDIVAIFSNIDIIYNFSKEMVQLLDERMKQWSPTQKIGDVFLRLVNTY